MPLDPIFVTRVTVATSRDFAMLSLSAPAGPVRNGAVETHEIVRVVMSYRGLMETAEAINKTLREIEALAQQIAPSVTASAPAAAPSAIDDRQDAEPTQDAESTRRFTVN